MPAGDRLLVIFTPDGGGISGREAFKTVGKQDRHGGYQVTPTEIVNGHELSITSGIFGQRNVLLEVVSGRYQTATSLAAESLTLAVRVSASVDSSCPVGSNGLVKAYIGFRGNRGTQITLCGETIDEPSEHVHLQQIQ